MSLIDAAKSDSRRQELGVTEDVGGGVGADRDDLVEGYRLRVGYFEEGEECQEEENDFAASAEARGESGQTTGGADFCTQWG